MVVEWFGIDGVLQHMRCSTELWVLVATSPMQSMGKKWWKSAHSTNFKSRQLERIAWLEFEGILYALDSLEPDEDRVPSIRAKGCDSGCIFGKISHLRERFVSVSFAPERKREKRHKNLLLVCG